MMMSRIGPNRLRDCVVFPPAFDSVVAVVPLVSTGAAADVVLSGVLTAVSDGTVAALDVVGAGGIETVSVTIGGFVGAVETGGGGVGLRTRGV